MSSVATFFLILLPWLNPFAPGPTAAVVPWLVALAATAGIILAAALRAAPERGSLAQRWARPAAQAWVVAGLISSVIGLLQYFGAAAALGPWVSQVSLGEAFANLRQRNQFASLTNIALAALVWLGVGMHGRFAGHHRWAACAAACLLAAGNSASSSRTGMLQLALLCALCLVWGGWHRPAARSVLLAAVLAYVLAILALPLLAGFDLSGHGMVARLSASENACASRITLWSNVLTLIAQKPWFGWGWGELDYAHYMTLYPGERFCDILDNAHNLPLHLAVELGIPLSLLVCGVSTWLVLRARPWGETNPTRQMAWSVLTLILLHSMLEYPLWYGPFQMAFGLSVYLLWATRLRPAHALRPAANSKPMAAGIQYFQATLGAVLMTAVAYAAWDYHRVSQLYLAPERRAATYRDDTLEKTRDTWLFRQQFDFAALSLTPLTRENALHIHDLSNQMLHFSPEPRVIEKVIESAVMLGRDEEALLHLARYRAAFPENHAQWRSAVVLGKDAAK